MAGSSSATSSSPRKCEECGRTQTSQWRYGRNDKMLLCNACGIKWKRKNPRPDSERLKPGPKRSSGAHGSGSMDLSSLLSSEESARRPPRSSGIAITELLNHDLAMSSSSDATARSSKP